MSQLATRLRQEAQVLEWAAARMLDEAELIQDRVTDMKTRARELRELATECEDAEHVAQLAGSNVLPLRRLA